MTRARPRPPLAESGDTSKVRHDEDKAHGQTDLIAGKIVCSSKPGLKITFGAFTRHITYISTYINDAAPREIYLIPPTVSSMVSSTVSSTVSPTASVAV